MNTRFRIERKGPEDVHVWIDDKEITGCLEHVNVDVGIRQTKVLLTIVNTDIAIDTVTNIIDTEIGGK